MIHAKGRKRGLYKTGTVQVDCLVSGRPFLLVIDYFTILSPGAHQARFLGAVANNRSA